MSFMRGLCRAEGGKHEMRKCWDFAMALTDGVAWMSVGLLGMSLFSI